MSKRKAAAVLVIISGMAGSFLILKSAPASEKRTALPVTENPGTAAENLAYEARSPEEPGALPAPDIIKYPKAETNLTNILANKYFAEIVKRNPNGLVAQDGGGIGIRFPNEDDGAKLIAEALRGELPVPQFTERDIRVLDNDSEKAQIAYLAELGAITEKNFGDFPYTLDVMLEEFIKNQNTDMFKKYIAIIPNHITDLLSTAAPPTWKVFHLQLVNLWQKKRVIYASLINFNTDPIKSLIAFDKIPDIVDEDILLQDTLNKKSKELSS